MECFGGRNTLMSFLLFMIEPRFSFIDLHIYNTYIFNRNRPLSLNALWQHALFSFCSIIYPLFLHNKHRSRNNTLVDANTLEVCKNFVKTTLADIG